MNCNNCNGPFDATIDGDAPGANGIIVRQGNDVVACVCGRCVSGVLLSKITLRRHTSQTPFVYDQYQPVESGKRFGTSTG